MWLSTNPCLLVIESFTTTEDLYETIVSPCKKSETCFSIHPRSSRSQSNSALQRILEAWCLVPSKHCRSGLVSDSPERSTHRTSLTAGVTALGPSDVLCLVSSSTTHGGTLIGLGVSLNGPQKYITSPLPSLMSFNPNSNGPSVSPWPRFVFITLWPIPISLRDRHFGVKGRRHFSVSVSISLFWLSDSESRTMVLLISLPWHRSEGNLVTECLEYYCRIDYVHCHIPDHTSDMPKEFQYPIVSTCQIRIQSFHRTYMMRDPNQQPIQKPFPTSSLMEMTILWSLHLWPPTPTEKPVFGLLASHGFLPKFQTPRSFLSILLLPIRHCLGSLVDLDVRRLHLRLRLPRMFGIYIGCARILVNAPFVTLFATSYHWKKQVCLNLLLVPFALTCQLLPQGRRLGSDLNSQGQPDYKLCVEFLNLHGQRLHVREDPPALLRLVTHHMRFPASPSSKATSTCQPSNQLVSSMEHTLKSSYASIVRAKYDHLLVRDFLKLVFKLESYKTSKDLPSIASSSRLCIFLEDSCSLYLYIFCKLLLLGCKNIPLLRF